ncbi:MULTISPECIES: hypothetical protein [Gemmobacter]|jgi:hypothetical protein|uniref:DUF3757 domain-containing protein n=1 Tax=Gemmobacter caeni TaxID=589035 RepID=A0A2T6APB1_9RHOB|nr:MULTISPECIES: hypothetical protein [Gemmobacter]PTX45586.1 hypothetical protein C8N34_12115 [Gemmobacter caeni]TWI93734.1 hypothetical protein IQ03_04494 [Gemmobacter caeni]
MRNVFGIAASVMLLAAGAAQAAPQALICTQKVSNYEWVMPEILFILDEAQGSAQVYDGVIAHFVGKKPIPAKLKADGDTVTWDVRVRGSKSARTGTIMYTATFSKDRRKVSLFGAPRGYDNSTNVRGTCKVLKDEPAKKRKK